MQDDTNTIYTFVKNSREEVRFSFKEYLGRELIDIRVYVHGDDDQDHPTRKGLTMSIERLDDLVAGITALAVAMETANATAEAEE